MRISGIEVGDYYLTYENSELKFHIEFNENIVYFQDISGFFKGSSTFKDVTEATVNDLFFMDKYYGQLTVEKKPEVVTPPSTPSGTAWKPSLPNNFNKDEKPSLKKDVKWFGNDAHQIDLGFYGFGGCYTGFDFLHSNRVVTASFCCFLSVINLQ